MLISLQLDCGIHPGATGIAALPFFDEADLGSVDILLISHFHLDHAAALPYLLAKVLSFSLLSYGID
jgi:cleavage and polyadenylation specificity factor subunit 3